MEMCTDLQCWANWAQILSLAVSLVALVVSFIAWVYPATILKRVRSWLPYIAIATLFFWLGTQLSTFSISSVQDGRQDFQRVRKEINFLYDEILNGAAIVISNPPV